MLALTAQAGAASPAVLDAVLADVDGATITASDIGVGRALSLFGMRPSQDPIREDDVRRLVDVRLMDAEAAHLELTLPAADIDTAWRAAADRLGGADALRHWMDHTELDEGWVRKLVETDLRQRRFVDARFRAFAFVTDDDADKALGPGPHTPEQRAQEVAALQEAATQREVAAWLTEARGRSAIRYVDIGEAGVPVSIPMPASAVP